MAANYSDERTRRPVFRFETIYDVGIPFFDVARETVVDTPALPGIRKKNMWKGMIAFDRPTWIRWLNKKSTWFLTGQFFWHYLVNNTSCDRRPSRTSTARRSVRSARAWSAASTCPSSRRLGTQAAIDAGSPAFRDKLRDWEALFTFAAFSFYRGGSIVPGARPGGRPGEPVEHGAVLGRRLHRPERPRREHRAALLRHPARAPHADLRDVGSRGLNQGRSETTIRCDVSVVAVVCGVA
jgi:hypothetical protein